MGRYDQLEQPKQINPFRVIIVILFIFLVAVAAGYLYYLSANIAEPQKQKVQQIKKQATQHKIPLKIPAKNSPNNSPNNVPLSVQTEQTNPPSLQPIPPATAYSKPDKPQKVKKLPPLNQSDAAVRLEINNISPQLKQWFTGEKLLRKYLNIINDLSQGIRPYKHFKFLTPKQPFTVKQDKNGLFIDPASYQRYDKLISTINRLNVAKCMQYYTAYKPLLNQVFAEFSYPKNYTIDDLLKKAIAQIIEAPLLEKRIAIIHHIQRYKFADQELEDLNPIYKQMLRMGPENTRILQHKLRQFAQALAQD